MNKQHSILLFVLLTPLATAPCVEAQNGKPSISAETLALYEPGEYKGVKYRLMKPIDFDPNKTYPLILSLHGGSGRGTQNIKNILIWNEYLADEELRRKHPCFVLAPQSNGRWLDNTSNVKMYPEPGTFTIDDLPESMRKFGHQIVARIEEANRSNEASYGVLDEVLEFIDTQLTQQYKIDSDRVYVLGHSMGAMGTFTAIYQHPDRFAAAIPSAGFFPAWLDAKRFKDIPLWIFHGDADKTVPYSGSRHVFDQLTQLNGNAKLTTLGGKGHGSSYHSFRYKGDDPEKGYVTEYASDRCDKTKRVWDWLFRQKRSKQVGDAALNKTLPSEFSEEIWASFDADALKPTEIFKVRDGVEMHYFAPAIKRVPGNNVVHLYIHGGGWRGGSPNGFYRWSRYLAERGVSAFALKYRLLDREKRGKPTICVEDAKSAMRWLRANAEKLGIDPERIAVGGNSAGAHLAAALATIEGYNYPSDDLSVKTTPNLLLLGSPPLDIGSFFGTDISPMHNLNENLPHTLAIMGDSDPVIPMTSMEVFGQGVTDAGSEFEWWIFPGKGHGLNAQNESYLTPELMHIYYCYINFLAKNDYVDEPLPAGDEVRTMIRRHKLGE